MPFADLIIQGGPIYTGVREVPWVQALAVQAGWVVAYGGMACVQAFRGPQTRRIDLHGRLALPGFHDAHCHLQWGSLARRRLDLSGARSVGEILERVSARAARTPPGSWIEGSGWDDLLLREGRPPRRAELDRAAPLDPVLLDRVDGHQAVASSRALAAAGIAAGTPDPPGGAIGREPGGEPDGVLLESAVSLVSDRIPPPSEAEKAEALAEGCRMALAAGVTSVQDHLGERPLYERLHAEGAPAPRATLWGSLDDPLDRLEALRASFPEGSQRVRFGLLKGFLDGSLGSRTAAFFDPYTDDPGRRGILREDPVDLIRRVVAADARGFQVGLHAIGDRAVALALDAFEEARRRNGPRDARHRVEHFQVAAPGDIERLAHLGVVASMQPSHWETDTAMVLPRIGAERARRAYAWRAVLDAGGALAFGSDYPVVPIDPLPGIAAAVLRQPGGDAVPRALTLAEALDAYTRGPAHAAHEEAWLGRLAPGQVADIVVLDRDVSRGPPGGLREARVDLALVGGEVAFERAGGDPAV